MIMIIARYREAVMIEGKVCRDKLLRHRSKSCRGRTLRENHISLMLADDKARCAYDSIRQFMRKVSDGYWET